MPTNVLGTELKCCCRDPVTGFYRDGFCRTGPEDVGLHTVCVKVTREFLDFSVLDGNDLVTPVPEWGYFCQISDSTTSFGSYSGAVPNEKITWGKLSVDTPKYIIESDATIVAPLVFAKVLGW